MTKTVAVSRYIELDAGHRVARHESKCRHLHGHRYRITVTIEGDIKDDDSPEHGMVIDFGRIKDVLTALHDELDHRFLIGADDPLLSDLSALPGVVVLPVQPTAENLAVMAMDYLAAGLAPLRVAAVEVQETAKCSASVTT